jgi:hypothetical protein
MPTRRTAGDERAEWRLDATVEFDTGIRANPINYGALHHIDEVAHIEACERWRGG